MQRKDITATSVERVEGTPSGFFIFHGHSDNTRVKFYVDPKLVVELAELYNKVGHAGHAIWHRDNKRPIPCSMCKEDI